MTRTILFVAYPLAAVGPDAVGGSEQILTHLDAAVTRAGHRSLVIACEGSTVTGTLLATPRYTHGLGDEVRRIAQEHYGKRIAEALARWPVDLVHMHGLDFHAYLPPPGVPVLATLHLPPDWYPERIYRLDRPDTHLNCVSASQQAACPSCAQLLPWIANGVPVDRLAARHAKRRFALMLARVCPEKGLHIALDAARRADMPLLIAGELFRYEAHERYFAQEVEPRLDSWRRFLGPVGFARKRRLLTAAQCLLVPSLVAETASLVAMEALACGTPVVAFRSGALPEIVEHGRTGFLVGDESEMAEAMAAARALDPEICREAARRRFSVERMTGEYLARYDALIGASRDAAPAQRRRG